MADRGRRAVAASLVSRGSLERLREEPGAEAPVDGRRFRMLFEIDGVPAHEEDDWIDRRGARWARRRSGGRRRRAAAR